MGSETGKNSGSTVNSKQKLARRRRRQVGSPSNFMLHHRVPHYNGHVGGKIQTPSSARWGWVKTYSPCGGINIHKSHDHSGTIWEVLGPQVPMFQICCASAACSCCCSCSWRHLWELRRLCQIKRSFFHCSGIKLTDTYVCINIMCIYIYIHIYEYIIRERESFTRSSVRFHCSMAYYGFSATKYI